MAHLLPRGIYYLMLILLLAACAGEEAAFGPVYPSYFPDPVYHSTTNPITEEGFALGRSLFFDPILSIDSTISCSSCHAQVHAFADHSTALSIGVNHRLGSRNSPVIINTLWQSSFMWDGGINHIEVMPIAPITSDVEMAQNLKDLVAKLNVDKNYQRHFRQVFAEDTITDQQVLYALTQYMTMLISADSKYDQVRKGSATFTIEEQDGYHQFKQKCASCHSEPLFTNHGFHNTGLAPKPGEEGRYRVTQDSADLYRFKVPTLRNVALSNPYKHDGRLRNLRQVLDHYTDDIYDSPTLDTILRRPDGTLGIDLSDADKSNLISFLHTLTDEQFIANPLLSE